MNGLNKELKRYPCIPRPLLNLLLTITGRATYVRARNAGHLAPREQDTAPAAAARQLRVAQS